MSQSLHESLERAFQGAECPGPVPRALIADAEQRTGLLFPPSYREFLAMYGAARGGLSVEIAGLMFPVPPANKPPGWCNVVEDTLRLRTSAAVPHRYLAISDDGMDCAYCLDADATSADGEGPVVALGPGRAFQVLAPSFLAFVELAAKGAMP